MPSTCRDQNEEKHRLVRKGLESENEESGSSESELSESEEPRMKFVLNNLSEAVSKKRASDLLHSMSTSRDILFWTPRGKLLRNNRIIPVTNIALLVEYVHVFLPYNEEVTKPCALDTFLDGQAELGIDKRLIRNKKLLFDLIGKEKSYGDKESDTEEALSDEEGEEDETASENSSEEEGSKEEEGVKDIIENESEETESSDSENSV